MRRRGNIEQRGENSWRVRYRGEKRTVHGTREDAQKALTQLEHEIDQGRYVRPAKQTYSQFLDEWLRDWVPVNVSPGTAEWYALIVKTHIKPALGEKKLSELTKADIQRYLSEKLKTHAKKTVRGHWAVIHGSLAWAEEIERISVNPCPKAPKVPKKEQPRLSMEGFVTLLRAAEATPHYALIMTALATGMSSGELLGLKWSDVDWRTGVITVRRNLRRKPGREPVFGTTKRESRVREVIMGKALAETLKRHRESQKDVPNGHELVFRWPDGRPMKGAWANRWLQKLASDAGLPKITFHGLRRTVASVLADERVNPKYIANLLGNDVLTALTHYVQPAMHNEAAAALDAIIAATRRQPKQQAE